MVLFFDTETTGLPQRWNAPVTDVNNWPRLVQLAWIMCDGKGNIIEERSDIVKPEGFAIPAGGGEGFIVNFRDIFGQDGFGFCVNRA